MLVSRFGILGNATLALAIEVEMRPPVVPVHTERVHAGDSNVSAVVTTVVGIIDPVPATAGIPPPPAIATPVAAHGTDFEGISCCDGGKRGKSREGWYEGREAHLEAVSKQRLG